MKILSFYNQNKNMDSIETNKRWKEEQKLLKMEEKARDGREKMILKRRSYRDGLHANAQEKVASLYGVKQAKDIAKRSKTHDKKRHKKIMNQKRLIKGNKEIKYKKKDKGVRRSKNRSFSEVQKHARLLKCDDNGDLITIDWQPRRWNGCQGGHMYPKYNFPHMIFEIDNIRPQTARSNKKQLDTVNHELLEEVKIRIWQKKYDALIKRANNNTLKAKYRIKPAEYYDKKYRKYKKLNDKIMKEKNLSPKSK